MKCFFVLPAAIATLLLPVLTAAQRINSDPTLPFLTSFLGEDHVTASFQSSEFLQMSLQLEKARGASTPLNDPLGRRHRVSCFTYANGQAIGDEARAMFPAAATALVPTLVDYENDLICYLVKTNPVAKKQQVLETLIAAYAPHFDQSVPTPLKIHHSLYDAIDALTSSRLGGELFFTNATHLTIAYHNISLIGTSSASSPTLTTLSSPLRDRIDLLARYDLADMSEFFWTSPLSRALLTTGQSSSSAAAPLDVQQDSQRMHRWSTLSQALELKLQEMRLLGLSDPCKLSQLDIEHFENKLSIQISHLLQNTLAADAAEASAIHAACLVYLTSTLAEDPSTVFLSLTSKPQLLNVNVRSIEQTNTIGTDASSVPYSAAGLLGDNQIVSVADTGLDETSCYFSDPSGQVPRSPLSQPTFSLNYRKVIGYSGMAGCDYTDEAQGHGTHVAGTIAGNIANSNLATDGQYDGVAPHAKLVILDIGNAGQGLYPCSANCLFTPGYQAGGRIHTNSWGSSFNGQGHYTGSDVDLYLFNHPEMIVFYAAGNTGTNGASSITMESSAKNVVSVGASETTLDSLDIHNVAWYSSLGPTYDGRIKPDIVAPGDSVISASSNFNAGSSCSTTEKTGTSMASPSAAGAAALIRQYFIDETFQFWSALCNGAYASCKAFAPSGVLTKAVILHSGSAMEQYWAGSNLAPLNPPPDSTQGYGLINLSNVLPLDTTSFDLFVDDLRTIGQNSLVTYTASVNNANVPLKVTVSWYDYPNIEGFTGSALINDLNLQVISLNGNVKYLGNVGTASASFDCVNNNEQVYVANPAVGDWQVVISTNALPYQGSQLFSIVITCGGTTTSH